MERIKQIFRLVSYFIIISPIEKILEGETVKNKGICCIVSSFAKKCKPMPHSYSGAAGILTEILLGLAVEQRI